MGNKRVVVFDVGGVLVRIDWGMLTAPIRELCSWSDREIRTILLNSTVSEDFSLGKIRSTEFFEHVRGQLEIDVSYDWFVTTWNRPLQANDELLRIVPELSALAVCVTGSNTNPLHHKYIHDALGIRRYFETWFTSYQLGTRKPSASFYLKVCGALRIDPNEMIVIDDEDENIRTAMRLGIQAIRYSDPQSLRIELNDFLTG